MSNQQGTRQAQGGPGSAPPSLPDLNAETYPFKVVQYLIDQGAFINTYAMPDNDRQNSVVTGNSGGVLGMELNANLHRFGVNVHLPETDSGVRASNAVGRAIGRCRHRWLVIPDDFSASPGRDPSPTSLDPSRSQRFVMQDGEFTFGNGSDGFRGFGTGRTYPVNSNGRQHLMAAAVGEVLDGYGRFRDLEGSYVVTGHITQERGFEGNIQCRLIDPRGQIRSESDLGGIDEARELNRNFTYILFRGQKRDSSVQTSYIFGPGGMPQGFQLWQELRIAHLNTTTGGGRGLRSSAGIGQVIGRMTSKVFLNIMNPGAPGTSLAPIPFSSYNEFFFTDDEGNTVGSFVAEQGEGRTFAVKLAGAPGQQALRFGAFQVLTNGTGCFSGVQGLLTDNSIVGVEPHATATLYSICVHDPDGRYRAALGGGH
jgi:hypothetical protein